MGLAILTFNASTFRAATPGISLVGKGSIAAALLDKSGLTGEICQAGVPSNCVSKAIFGGFGSDITYTGHDNAFLSAPDRGPFDGLTDVPFLDRFHFLHITTDVGASFPNFRTVLLDTRFFKNESGQNFVGAAGAFDLLNPLATLRFDPEGIRVSANENFYVSDEYGPYIIEFDRQGNLVRRIAVPEKFLLANPSPDRRAFRQPRRQTGESWDGNELWKSQQTSFQTDTKTRCAFSRFLVIRFTTFLCDLAFGRWG